MLRSLVLLFVFSALLSAACKDTRDPVIVLKPPQPDLTYGMEIDATVKVALTVNLVGTPENVHIIQSACKDPAKAEADAKQHAEMDPCLLADREAREYAGRFLFSAARECGVRVKKDAVISVTFTKPKYEQSRGNRP